MTAETLAGDIPAALRHAKERCGIAHFSRRLIRNLSGGYRQRVGIAQAIIHRPKLVVLDEPTNGLDPNQIVEVRALIKEIAEERAVLFSTHILSEVQATCRRVMMISGGRVVFSDTIEAFNSYQAGPKGPWFGVWAFVKSARRTISFSRGAIVPQTPNPGPLLSLARWRM